MGINEYLENTPLNNCRVHIFFQVHIVFTRIDNNQQHKYISINLKFDISQDEIN